MIKVKYFKETRKPIFLVDDDETSLIQQDERLRLDNLLLFYGSLSIRIISRQKLSIIFL